MKFLQQLKHLFGFERNKKPVRDYLYDQNVRSSIFMAAVIFLLEIWLIIRQIVQHIVPEWGDYSDKFIWIYSNLSVFLLFLLSGFAMFVFAVCYSHTDKVKHQNRLIASLVSAGILFLYSLLSMYPLASISGMYSWGKLVSSFKSGLLLTIYASGLLLGASIIYYTLFWYFRKKESRRLSVMVIIFFALLCLVFGFRVSFSDHIRSITSVAHPQNEIICFLTMVIFVSAVLIYKPFISIVVNIAAFFLFYVAIYFGDQVREEVGVFTDGDKVNYVTFLVALTTVSVMIYHQRLRSAVATHTLRHNAEYDELTGLNNSYLFNRKLSDILATNTQKRLNEQIVLFIDVFNFKVFNEQRGFSKGNEFLIDLARMIERIFPGDLMCRDNGDQYVVVTEVSSFKTKINALRKEVKDYDKEIKPSIRVGGYILNNPNEDVRRIVDKARYACGSIADRLDIFFVEYDKAMHDNYHFNQYVIRTLEDALENGHIKPFYQPVISSKDSKICSMEALVRWEDPKKGKMFPDQFIPTLEKTKLIHKLDAALIEAVFKDMKDCLDNGIKVVPCSVNISRLDFQLMNVVGLLDMLVEKYDIPKNMIHIEVTESALTDNEVDMITDLNILKENGYHIWLDDFGSAYSSFSTLKDYDFEVLKLDMRFISNFEKQEKNKIILEAIFNMAKALNMRTVVEGVETEIERDFLIAKGATMMQGYLFSKPIAKEEYFEKLNNGDLQISDYMEY